MSLPDFTVYSQLPTGAYMKKSDRSGPYAWDGSAMILTGFLDASENGEAATLTVTTGFVADSGAKFSIFNTADKVTNFEKGEIAWATNVLTFGTSKGGTGTARALAFLTDGTERGRFNAAGGFGLTTGNTFDLYNTADQTTNYERLRVDWSVNVARLLTQASGTGVVRGISVASGTYGGSSGTVTPFTVNSTFNQAGTAGYILADFNATETATGSGTKLLQRWAVGGTEKGRVGNDGAIAGLFLSSTGNIGFSPAFGSANDVTLFRDAADTLALRRSTNAQTFRVYNTYTDGSNNERGNASWISNVFTISTSALGTGIARPMTIGPDGSAYIALRTAGADRWVVTSAGNLTANVDNILVIGAAASGRPNIIHVGSGGVVSANATLITSSVALTNGAAAQVATMTNGPTAGNPTKWIPINDNGTTRYIPAW